MRLFIAIDPDDGVKNCLKRCQDELKEAGVTGNYSSEQNLHLTLAFIGEFGNPDAVLDAMERVCFESFILKTEET